MTTQEAPGIAEAQIHRRVQGPAAGAMRSARCNRTCSCPEPRHSRQPCVPLENPEPNGRTGKFADPQPCHPFGNGQDQRHADADNKGTNVIVLNSAKNPNANTNDGTRGFAINPLAAQAIRQFGTPGWAQAVAAFLQGRTTLAEELNRHRDLARVPVRIRPGLTLTLSAGGHNALQKQIIESFLPIYGHGCDVLYVGDTTQKNLFVDKPGLERIRFFELAHDKLPDVIAYSASRNWLYLIEAVTRANPITELRRRALLEAAANCTADLIFVTAFPDRDTYRKFAKDIAWETEVWIADAPEHMIHFNGDKFLGPHKAG